MSALSTILVADDDAAMRALLAAALAPMGHPVRLVADGKELRKVLTEARARATLPIAVVADIRMPKWTGLSALAWIRYQMPTVPVVLITAFGDPQTHRRAAELGAAAVLDKPFELTELRRILEELLTPTPAASGGVGGG